MRKKTKQATDNESSESSEKRSDKRERTKQAFDNESGESREKGC